MFPSLISLQDTCLWRSSKSKTFFNSMNLVLYFQLFLNASQALNVLWDEMDFSGDPTSLARANILGHRKWFKNLVRKPVEAPFNIANVMFLGNSISIVLFSG